MQPLGGNGRQDSAFNIDHTRAIMAGGKLNGGIEWNGGEKYNVVGKLGSGAFAVVYKLATKRDGDLYAVKQIEKRKFIKNGVLDNKIKNEMHIMKDLEHVSCNDKRPATRLNFRCSHILSNSLAMRRHRGICC